MVFNWNLELKFLLLRIGVFLAVGTTSAAPWEGVRRGSTWSARKMTRRCW